MKVDHAPASEPTIGAKICTALVSTVECVIPSLTKSLRLEPRDFGEILPVRFVLGTSSSKRYVVQTRTHLRIVV